MTDSCSDSGFWELVWKPGESGIFDEVSGQFLQLLTKDGVRFEAGPGESLSIHVPAFSEAKIFVSVVAGQVVVMPDFVALARRLKQHGSPLTIDWNYACEYLRFQCPNLPRTLCAQIFSPRMGERIEIDRTGTISWSLDDLSAERARPPDIEAIVSRRIEELDPESTEFHISSGLDSSLLALVASKLFPTHAINVATCLTLGRGAADELEVVRQLAESRRWRLRIHDFSTCDVFDAGREMIADCTGYPTAHPSHLLEYLLDREASRAGFTTVVSGRGPDECLGGYSWHSAEYGNPELYLERLRVTSDSFLRDVFNVEVSARIEQSEFETLVMRRGSPLSLHERLAFDLRGISNAWQIMQNGIGHGLGIRVETPLQQSDLTSGLYSLPPSEMRDQTQSKIYMRRTLAHVYPDFLLRIPKMGFRIDLAPYMTGPAEAVYERLFGDSTFAKRYLTTDSVTRSIGETIGGTRNWGWQIWSLYLLAVSVDEVIGE